MKQKLIFKPVVIHIPLTLSEMTQIKNCALTGTAKTFRDRFLIGFFLAMHPNDYLRVNKCHISNNQIIIKGENGAKRKFPLFPDVKAIFDQYPENIPEVPENHAETFLRIIAEKAGLTELITVEMRVGEATFTQVNVPKYELVTPYTPRISHWMELCSRNALFDCIKYIIKLTSLQPEYIHQNEVEELIKLIDNHFYGLLPEKTIKIAS